MITVTSTDPATGAPVTTSHYFPELASIEVMSRARCGHTDITTSEVEPEPQDLTDACTQHRPPGQRAKAVRTGDRRRNRLNIMEAL